jgi:hypothetical protein
MQWYVYLIAIPAVAFLGWITVELIGRPLQVILRLREHVLERILASRDMPLPGPRELAVSSKQILAYDQAVQNLRHAQRTFADLGAQLLAFAESEPAIRAFVALGGLDILRAGDELIHLSEIYAAARIDSEECRRTIEYTYHAASCALGVRSRRSGGDELTRIRLEPMALRETTSRRRARQYCSRPHVTRRAPSRARSASRSAVGFGK